MFLAYADYSTSSHPARVKLLLTNYFLVNNAKDFGSGAMEVAQHEGIGYVFNSASTMEIDHKGLIYRYVETPRTLIDATGGEN